MKGLIKTGIALLTAFLTLTTTLPAADKITLPYAITSAENFKTIATELALNKYEGRAAGKYGGNLAAKYIADKFESIGLKNIPGGSYFQNVPLHEIKTKDQTELTITNGEDSFSPTLNSDYFVYKSGSMAFLPKDREMVFAGYGIDAPEFNYNDYKQIDVVGKIVVVLTGEPYSERDDYFNGTLPTIYSYFDLKQKTALSKGAIACVIIPNPEDYEAVNWSSFADAYSQEDVSLAYSPSDNLALVLKPTAAKILFENSGIDFEKIKHLYMMDSIYSFPLKATMSFKGYYNDKTMISPNVIGVIEGSDPELRKQYVLVTAHYDHLGIGVPVKGDSIYNGFMDNAMGVAAMLEIARSFAEMPVKPKRSIIFIATTAEERGLLGSIHYISHPIAPLNQTIANVNIDGVAFFDQFKSVIGIGAQFSTLQDILNLVANNNGMSVEMLPAEFKEAESFNRSDQVVFAKAGIPAVLIMDGTEYVNESREKGIAEIENYMVNIYHSPQDESSLPINYDASLQHINFIFAFVNELTNGDQKPRWNSGIGFLGN